MWLYKMYFENLSVATTQVIVWDVLCHLVSFDVFMDTTQVIIWYVFCQLVCVNMLVATTWVGYGSTYLSPVTGYRWVKYKWNFIGEFILSCLNVISRLLSGRLQCCQLQCCGVNTVGCEVANCDYAQCKLLLTQPTYTHHSHVVLFGEHCRWQDHGLYCLRLRKKIIPGCNAGFKQQLPACFPLLTGTVSHSSSCFPDPFLQTLP